jgi:hypothetical protein
MPSFEYASSPHSVRPEIAAAQRAFWGRLPRSGSWWTGTQRIAFAQEARAAFRLRSEPPWLRKLPAPADDLVPASAIETVRVIALDAHKIDRDWCLQRVEAAGHAAYVELVAITVQTIAIDAFAEALGVELEPLPAPQAGVEPNRIRPEGVGDIGAHVDAMLAYPGPNVGRAMSLAPDDNATFFGLVASMYAVADFAELVWKDRPLTRPQVELVAARVSAINECFY